MSEPDKSPRPNMPASAPEAVARMKEHHNRKKNMFFGHFDRISLSSKLVACTIAVLLIGVSVISFSIRALVSNYMLSKTDNQLKSQSQMVFENIVTLAKNDNAGPNSYFLQIQYTDGTLDNEGNPLVVTPLMPQLQDGIVSVPVLPTDGDTSGITFGQPFTTQAVVKQVVQVQNNSSDSNNTTKPQTDPNTQDDAGNDAGNSGSKNAPNSSNSVTTILSNPSSNAVVLSFWRWQFIEHCLKELCKKHFAINFIHQQHFFRSLIRELTDCRRHKFQSGSCFLYKQSIIIDSTDDFTSVIEDKFSHHRTVRNIVQIG